VGTRIRYRAILNEDDGTRVWDPACAGSHLTFNTNNGLWEAKFQIPAGEYEYKVAIDDSWDCTRTIVAATRSGGRAHKYVGTQNAGDLPRRSLQLDEVLGYAVRMRARAARRFSARRSSSLRPPQTP
jgi:hypothetical protein